MPSAIKADVPAAATATKKTKRSDYYQQKYKGWRKERSMVTAAKEAIQPASTTITTKADRTTQISQARIRLERQKSKLKARLEKFTRELSTLQELVGYELEEEGEEMEDNEVDETEVVDEKEESYSPISIRTRRLDRDKKNITRQSLSHKSVTPPSPSPVPPSSSDPPSSPSLAKSYSSAIGDFVFYACTWLCTVYFTAQLINPPPPPPMETITTTTTNEFNSLPYWINNTLDFASQECHRIVRNWIYGTTVF